jgi:branched-chain amino acid transport system substrate-binding protein
MIGGPISFDAKGQNTAIGTAVVQNQKQTPVVVYPADVAAGAPVLPLASWQGRK